MLWLLEWNRLLGMVLVYSVLGWLVLFGLRIYNCCSD